MEIADAAQLVLEAAREFGATAADTVVVRTRRLEVTVRHGQVEKVSQAEERRLGLRVFHNGSSAVASTANLEPASVREFAGNTYALAKIVAADEYAGLPAAEELAHEFPDLDLFDPRVPNIGPEEARELALRAEAAALSADGRIANSEGAECVVQTADVYYAATAGFAGGYRDSGVSLSVTPVAKDASGMQRDHWYCLARHWEDLESPEQIGKEAAARAVRRLGARSVRSCEVPVVFDPETAGSLVRHLASAVTGQAVYRGTSFLVDRLGEVIAPRMVTIVDDGRVHRGLGSKPFDAEGVATRRTVVVEEGQLRSYLLDTYAARRLGLRTTGNATRAAGSAPFAAPTNFYLQAGTVEPSDIVRSVKQGLYVTELIGFGVNVTSGDYSRGAVGVWIENGELAFPVEEVTIAGNLREMFLRIEAVGNDLVMRRTVACPTLLLGKVTVAGSG